MARPGFLPLPIYTVALGKSYGSHELGFPHLKMCMVPTMTCHGLLCVSQKTCQSFYENTAYISNGRHSNCYLLFVIYRSVTAICLASHFHFKLSYPCLNLQKLSKQVLKTSMETCKNHFVCLFVFVYFFYAISWFVLTKPM